MPAPIPRFVRRMLLLRRARAAARDEAHERVLELCADPELAGSTRAHLLREAAIERLAREAVRAPDGLAESPAFATLLAHAPERALVLRRELATPPANGSSSVAASASGSKALGDLLADLRRRVPERVAEVEHAANNARVNGEAGATSGERDEPRSDDERRARGPVFRLAVDDGGEHVVALGERVVIGHLRSSKADLPFLADVESEHAELVLSASFHAGPCWRLVPLAPRRKIVARGSTVPPEGVELQSGDRVELARNLAFRFLATDGASSSAVLELELGAECHGAQRVLLFADGPAGRVRVGRSRRRLVTVADLDADVTLERDGGELRVHCAGGIRADVEGALDVNVVELRVACPPASATSVRCSARAPTRPPFGLLLRPIARSGEEGSRT